MENRNLKAIDIITFIPSGKDYQTLIEFYLELGFDLDWKSKEMALLRKD